MTLIKDIKTKHWSLSIKKPGEIVSDLDDINQCIYLILTTSQGTDRMRPTFGCGIFKYLDKPVNTVISSMAKAVGDALQIWEPRITIKKITIGLDELSTVIVDVEWESNISQITTTTSISYNNTNNNSSSKIEYSDEYGEEYN